MGEISYPGVYPEGHDSELISAEDLERQAAQRWAELPRIMGRADSINEVWEATMQEVAAGWLEGPINAPEMGEGAVPVRRFAVWQKGKLRCCDNFKRSRVNEATLVKSPIALPSVDHLVAIADAVRAGHPVAFFKADHEAALKQLPLKDDHAKYAVVAVLCPETGQPRYFRSKTLMFGATSSVVHYNAVSRAVASLAARVLGIPIIGYFDDFAGAVQRGLEQEALQLFCWLNRALGFLIKDSKCDSGEEIEFLGIQLSADGTGPVSVSMSDERGDGLLKAISTALESGSLRPPDAAVLAGKLGFAQYYIFGRFGRAFLPRLYAHAAGSECHLSAGLRGDLEWWEDYIRSAPSRLMRRPPSKPTHVIYTDANGLGGLGAVVIRPGGRRRTFHGSAPPSMWPRLASTSAIYALEVLAVLRILRRIEAELAGATVRIFVDNDAATISLVAGRSRAAVVNEMVREAWLILARKGASAWLERVDTKSNPADEPSRASEMASGWVRF